jgi:hypothetical protein
VVYSQVLPVEVLVAQTVSLCRQVDQIFKLMSAGFAGPHVTNAVIRQMLSPCRGDHISTTLRTFFHVKTPFTFTTP